MVNSLIRFQTIMKSSTPSYEIITIKAARVYITNAYISPTAKAQEEDAALNVILRESRGNSILTGDLNARHKQWDKRTNTRGRKLLIWASDHGWKIKAPPNDS